MVEKQLVVALLYNAITVLFALNGEQRLMQNLFANYTTQARPVANDSDPVNVSMGIELNQLIDLNEKSESLQIFIFIRQYWNDPSLMWDPALYNNVSTINISPNNLWLPDITLVNNVEKDHSFGGSLDTLKNRVILKSDGNITWLTPALLTSKCSMNIQYFPFDTQVCELVFTSWTYTGNQLDLKPTELTLGSYSNHSEWDLEKTSVYRQDVVYMCCPGSPFPNLHFKLVLKRRPLFYLLNLILPIVTISMLTVLIFYLPSESGERISFGVTIFLSLTVFMLIVEELIPATSDSVPLVILFFTCIMVEMVLTLISLCYILRLYLKSPEDEPMSKWMRKYIYENLSYKLGMRSRRNKLANHTSSYGHKNREMEMKNVGDKNGYSQPEWSLPYQSNGMRLNGNINTVINRNNGGKQNKTAIRDRPPTDKNGISHLDSVFLNKIDTVLQRFENEDEEKERLNEWRVCAMTFDRLALIVFLCTFLLTIFGCFLIAPNI